MAFQFTPSDGYRNTVSFPTKPANETAFRDSMQDLLDQVAAELNSGDSSAIGLSSLYRQPVINGNLEKWELGTSFSTVAAGTYTANRFQVIFNQVTNNVKILQSSTVPNTASNFSARLEQMTAVGAVGDFTDYGQPIEYVGAFAGKTVTFNAQIKCDSGASAQLIVSSDQGSFQSDIITSATFTNASVTATLASNITSLSVFVRFHRAGLAVGAGINIAQICMNKGNVSLPFQPQNITQEELNAYRYNVRLSSPGTPFFVFGHGYAFSSTLAYIFIPMPVRGRLLPTLITSGLIRVSAPTGDIATTSITLFTALSRSDLIVLQANVASGLTAGQGVVLQANNDGNAYINLDMEM